jgi:hypothetical protein
VGTVLVEPHAMRDPRYRGGEWTKYRAVGIDRVRIAGSNQVTVFNLDMHYLWNSVTKSTAQVKLKNTKEDGCIGKVRLAQTTDRYEPSYGFNGNYQVEIYGHWEWVDFWGCDAGGCRYVNSHSWEYKVDSIVVTLLPGTNSELAK